MAEELWQIYGHTESIALSEWPKVNEAYLQENSFEYPVSFNGKMRFKMEFPIDTPKEAIEKAVLEHEKAQKWIEGKQVAKIIVVPKKIVNVVVK